MADRLVSYAAGCAPELELDPLAFVRAAAAAGWRACGIWCDEASWTNKTGAQIRQVLDDHDMVALDCEVVRLEVSNGARLLDAAAQTGARNVLAVSSLADDAQTTAAFADLCQRAAPLGITVCLEYLMIMRVQTLEQALAIIADADQPNAAVLVDTLHLFRSGGTLEGLRQVDPTLMTYAQWCDGPAQPADDSAMGLVTDAIDARSNPGGGALPVAEFVEALPAGLPLSMEIRSKALRERFRDHVARARNVREAAEAALEDALA
jgi:sugar phosphate isomerase/epimerase